MSLSPSSVSLGENFIRGSLSNCDTGDHACIFYNGTKLLKERYVLHHVGIIVVKLDGKNSLPENHDTPSTVEEIIVWIIRDVGRWYEWSVYRRLSHGCAGANCPGRV